MAWMVLLAEATEGAANWGAVLGPLINGGFAVGAAWYLLTRSLPQAHSKFSQALADLREQFETRDRERQRDYQKALDKILEHCRAETAGREDTIKVELNLLHTTLTQLSALVDEVTAVRKGK